MTTQQAIKQYKIKNMKRLERYLEWCRSQGWVPGTGVECEAKNGCQYETDGQCLYAVDCRKRRPCPPWDCTCYLKGKGRRKKYGLEEVECVHDESGTYGWGRVLDYLGIEWENKPGQLRGQMTLEDYFGAFEEGGI